jgi:hypothetical protein
MTRYFFECLLTGWVYRFTPGEGSQRELAERAVEWECLRYTTTTGYNSINSSEWTIGPTLSSSLQKCGSPETGFPTTDCEVCCR